MATIKPIDMDIPFRIIPTNTKNNLDMAPSDLIKYTHSPTTIINSSIIVEYAMNNASSSCLEFKNIDDFIDKFRLRDITRKVVIDSLADLANYSLIQLENI